MTRMHRIDGWNNNLRRAYMQHMHNAKRRGVAFEFTYPDWVTTWLMSGHLGKRGKRSHEYVMARFNDCGAYSPSNVKIVTNAENLAEQKRIKHPEMSKRNIENNPMRRPEIAAKNAAARTGRKTS